MFTVPVDLCIMWMQGKVPIGLHQSIQTMYGALNVTVALRLFQ